MQPAKLLKHFSVLRIAVKHSSVRSFGAFVLQGCQKSYSRRDTFTHIFLLFMNVADLEPDVLLVKWSRWIGNNVLEALSSKSAVATDTARCSNSPPSSVGIFAAACKLCRDGNRSHWLFQNQAACALPVRTLLRHAQENRICRKGYQYHTIILAPLSC